MKSNLWILVGLTVVIDLMSLHHVLASEPQDVFAQCGEFISAEKARQNPSLYEAGDIIMRCFDPYKEHNFHVDLERYDFRGPTNLYIPGYILHVHVLTLSESKGQKIAEDFAYSVREDRMGRLLGFPVELNIHLPK